MKLITFLDIVDRLREMLTWAGVRSEVEILGAEDIAVVMLDDNFQLKMGLFNDAYVHLNVLLHLDGLDGMSYNDVQRLVKGHDLCERTLAQYGYGAISEKNAVLTLLHSGAIPNNEATKELMRVIGIWLTFQNVPDAQ